MKKNKHLTKNHQALKPKTDERKPFIEHIYELRRRLIWIAGAVIIFATLGYFIQQQLVSLLLKPSHGQQFIYTSPLGGLNFLFQVCIYFGLLLSVPVIVYQVLKYMEPLLRNASKAVLIKYTVSSYLLGVAGISFGYFLGLPIALGFLSHQFTTVQIKPLLTIQEYMSFVTLYLLGSALLFQLPLIILFLNRIKPLKPRQLLHFERYMLLIAFVAAAIMTPTTDIFDQLVFAVPIMLMYQLAVGIIYLQNRRHRRDPSVVKLMEQDVAAQQQRAEVLSRPLPLQPVAPVVRHITVQTPVAPAQAISTRPAPRRISDVFVPTDDQKSTMRFSAT